MYGEDLPAKRMFEMVICNTAKALRMNKSIGSLKEGKFADVLIMKITSDDPYENIIATLMTDIELSVLSARIFSGKLIFRISLVETFRLTICRLSRKNWKAEQCKRGQFISIVFFCYDLYNVESGD